MSEFGRLGHALLAGAVGGNPSFLTGADSANMGWRVATSENAALIGQPLGDGNHYAARIGVLVRTLRGHGALDDEPLPKVQPPVELPTPMLGTFDAELADATYGVLKAGGAPSRKLQRALDWYRVALCNAEAVPLDVRVGAARSALEVLLASGEETKKLVRAYGRLVNGTEDEMRIYEGRTEVFWSKGDVELTPAEWWLTRLCDLRNAIMHGDDVPEDRWQHDGQHHLHHLHDNLLIALRIYLADETDDEFLKIPVSDRGLKRAHQEAVKILEEQHETK